MLLSELLELGVARAIEAKDHSCRHGPIDLPSMLTAYRGEDLISIVYPPLPEAILDVFMVAAAGFDADVMLATAESYTPLVSPNPATGQEWGPGEMQDVAENRGGIENGWITECLSVIAVNRAGDAINNTIPYRMEGNHPCWGKPLGVSKHGGGFTKVMLAAMNAPSMSVLHPIGIGEATRAERDVLATWWLVEHHDAMVLMAAQPDEDERRQVLIKFGLDHLGHR